MFVISLAGGAYADEFILPAMDAAGIKASASTQLPAVKPEKSVRANTVTIYFCGTAITKDWWRAEDAHSPDGSSGFWSSELVSTLFHEQDADSYKLVVNGIGTDDLPGSTAAYPVKTSLDEQFDINSLDQNSKGLYGQYFPSSFLTARDWNKCVDEAVTYINSVLASTTGDITLNLVGHSRGGVLTMLTADKIKNNPRIKTINILALEPVPGDGSVPAVTYSLNEKIKNYIGLYAEDERTWMFEPVIPAAGPETNTWLLRLPGSHEAMAGNTQKDGHSKNYYISRPTGDENKHLPELEPVGRLAKIIATELLASRDWGGVRFNRSWRQGTIEGSKKELIKTAVDMRSAEAAKLYRYQRTVSWLPSLIPFYTSLEVFSGGRAQKVSRSEALSGFQNEPRVVYKMEGGVLRTRALSEAIPARENPRQILNRLIELGGLN
ncbi:MAG: hypothetical protein NTX59_12040 [Elusimicrobia bacterium]|nr:hypothetical protein [Elusimicrobiota bacterium]